MQRRRYFIYDVFSYRRLAGNPLAVVMDKLGFSTANVVATAKKTLKS